MIKVTFMLFEIWIALWLVIGSDIFTYPSKATVIPTIDKDLKYEYCVKIVRVCYLLWDSAPDYADDVAEEAKNTDTDNSAIEMEEDFRNAGCIPENLTDYQRDEFWKRVAILHDDISQLLLKTHSFVIKEYPEDGNAIILNMWNVFKIPMVVICNRENDLSTPTTNSTPDELLTTKGDAQTYSPPNTSSNSILEELSSTSTTIDDGSNTSSNIKTTPMADIRWVCGKPYKIALWIDQQVESTQEFRNVNKRMSQIIEKRPKQMPMECCPYKSVMDRIEIIHDIVDAITQIRNFKLRSRSKSSGYMWLDFDHLNARLDSLNEQFNGNLPAATTIASNKCCLKWDKKVKEVENKFISQSTTTEIFESNKSLYNDALESQTEIEKYWCKLKKRLQKLENFVLPSVSVECCKKIELKMKRAKNLTDFLKPNDVFKYLADLLKRLFKHFSYMNDTISSVNLLIQMEGSFIKNVTLRCSRNCVKNEQYKGKEISHLKTKINSLLKNTELIQSNISSYDSFKTTLSKWYSLKSKLRTFENSSNLESNNTNILSQCLEKLHNLTKLFQETVQLYEANVKANEGIKNAVESRFKKMYLKYQLIEKFLNKASTFSVENRSVNQAPLKDLKQFLRQVSHDFQFVVSPLIISYLKRSKFNSTFIKFVKSNLMNNLTTNTLSLRNFSINLNNPDSYLKSRINKLESEIILTNKNISNDLFLSRYNKFKNLESRFNNIKNQNLSSENKVTKRIRRLKSLLKDLNDKINKNSEVAFICEDDCDWGHLPPAETLTHRIERIKTIFNAQ